MKKLLLFFLIACACISCTENNEITPVEPAASLEKVIFNASSATNLQRHWSFNEDGLLSSVTDGNGTVFYHFNYDTNNRVTQATKFNTNGTPTVYSFTYDTNGNISHLNNVALNFDAGLDAYYFGNLTTSYRAFKLNQQGLMTYNKNEYIEVENGIAYPYISSQAYAIYENGNLKGQSFHNGTFAGFLHDNQINPLHNASIAVFRAMAVTPENEQWLNSYAVSANNVIRKNYPVEDHIHEEYSYAYNDDNLPVSATLNFYSNNIYDFSVVKTLYYYQGE